MNWWPLILLIVAAGCFYSLFKIITDGGMYGDSYDELPESIPDEEFIKGEYSDKYKQIVIRHIEADLVIFYSKTIVGDTVWTYKSAAGVKETTKDFSKTLDKIFRNHITNPSLKRTT